MYTPYSFLTYFVTSFVTALIIQFAAVFAAPTFCIHSSASEISETAFENQSYSQADFSSESANVQQKIGEILNYKMTEAKVNTLQELINNEFEADSLDGSTQTYVLALIADKYRTADFNGFGYCLSQNITSITSPTSRQKALITLYRTDSSELISDEIKNEILTDTIGVKGIMSYIYGLRMLEECKIADCDAEKEEIISTLLSMQLSDGGFSLTGDSGDVDVTAMVIQALAPAYLSDASQISQKDTLESNVTEAVDRALSFLASSQLPAGDFASYNSPCSESTAQVIIALCKLGINPLADSDFIKNDNNVLDGLLIYQTKDGGFSHINDGINNNLATSQALEALVSLGNLLPYYEGEISGLSLASNTSFSERIISFLANHKLKLIIISALVLVSLILILFVITPKVKSKKKRTLKSLSVLLIALIASIIVWNITIQTSSDFVNSESNVLVSEKENAIEVSFTISSKTVSDDIIYQNEALYVRENSTVFEVLQEICRTENIQFDYESNSTYGLAYIKGINSLYEFDYGDLSGWMYRVNGEFPSVGCGYYKLQDGDVVEWLYTTNLGEDLK